jgi:hypothetical protein
MLKVAFSWLKIPFLMNALFLLKQPAQVVQKEVDCSLDLAREWERITVVIKDSQLKVNTSSREILKAK